MEIGATSVRNESNYCGGVARSFSIGATKIIIGSNSICWDILNGPRYRFPGESVSDYPGA